MCRSGSAVEPDKPSWSCRSGSAVEPDIVIFDITITKFPLFLSDRRLEMRKPTYDSSFHLIVGLKCASRPTAPMLVEIRGSNLSDAGSIPAISTFKPLRKTERF